MNSPFLPLTDEIRRVAAAGFDYVDLTLEPPRAWPVAPEEVRRLLDDTGVGVVGHTAFYLPIASPFPPVRRAARELFVAALDAFAVVGAARVNVHPDPVTRSFPRGEVLAGNADAVVELTKAAAERGIELMVENLGPAFGTVDALKPLLEAHPGVRFHLDVGHAHLGGDRTAALLAAFGERLVHVHVSDNFGADDLHLPLGAGSISWPDVIRRLKDAGYDGTVTLEIFSPDRRHLDLSQRVWQELWDGHDG